MEQRNCLECGEPLRGRADQKFCSDACRNSYNNQKLGSTSNFMRKINRILKKNHSILQQLNPDGKTTTFKGVMIKQGFNFNHFTHVYKTKNGKVYYFCYDQGFLSLENNKFLLVKKEE
jgi:predicted nucleic acid-binding Zn ribbon protein